MRLILQYKSEQRYDDALQAIDQAALALMKINLQDIETMAEDDLQKYIAANDYREQQIEILAGLIREKAEIYYETNQVFSCETLFERALYLYEKAEGKTKDYSIGRKAKMDRIREMLFHLREA